MKVPDASMSEFSRGGEIFFAEVTQPSLLVAAITRAPGDDGEIFLLGCEIRRFCSFCCGVGWGEWERVNTGYTPNSLLLSVDLWWYY